MKSRATFGIIDKESDTCDIVCKPANKNQLKIDTTRMDEK